MVNTVYEEHNTVPKRLTAQGDNAATNNTRVVLGVLGVYGIEGVTEEGRLRMCMEDHAHDVYDAYHGIHVTRLSQETYFTIDEMEHVIIDAHRQAYCREYMPMILLVFVASVLCATKFLSVFCM